MWGARLELPPARDLMTKLPLHLLRPGFKQTADLWRFEVASA